jgi:type IV secretory pathway VirB2 component (pilin)
MSLVCLSASSRASATDRSASSSNHDSASNESSATPSTPASSSARAVVTPTPTPTSSLPAASDAAASAAGSAAASKGGISTGAVAAIVVVIAVVALGLIAFLGRMAYKKRKAARAPGAGWHKTDADDDVFGMAAEKGGNGNARGMDGGNRLQYAPKNEPMSWGNSSFGNRDCKSCRTEMGDCQLMTEMRIAEMNSAAQLLSPAGTHTSGSMSAQQEHHMSNFSDQPFSPMGMGMGMGMGAGPNHGNNQAPAGVMYQPHPDSPGFGPSQVQREQEQHQPQQVVAGDAAVAAAALQSDNHNQANPSTAENGPFADPANVNKIFIVRRTFEPSLSDELIIFVS